MRREKSRFERHEVDMLKKNPVFVMSLGSKELFHSNFLAWLLEQDEESRAKLRKLFLFEPGMEVEREAKGFDLLLSGNDKRVVIENKFKSLPSVEQLEAYSKKIKKDFKGENVCKILLAPQAYFDALADELSLVKDWKHVYYEKVIEVLSGETDSIISYYCAFVRILLNAMKTIGRLVNRGENIFGCLDGYKEDCKDLRIWDLIQKSWAGFLRNRLICKSVFLEKYDSEEKNSPIAERIGYTREDVLLNFLRKYPGFEDVEHYGIQIQGKKVKVVVCFTKGKSKVKKEVVKAFLNDSIKGVCLNHRAVKFEKYQREKKSDWGMRSYKHKADGIFLYEQIDCSKADVSFEELQVLIEKILRRMGKLLGEAKYAPKEILG